MGRAYAATEGAAAHGDAFYLSPEFWVAVSFVILIALLAKPIWRMAVKALDERIEQIRTRLDEATKLREEAQDLLAGYKRNLADAEQEAEDIVARAREEAETLGQRLAEDLEISLKRREQMAVDRIARAEAEATAEMRTMASDLALKAARRLLEQSMTDDKAKSLIDDAIKELPGKLN